LLFGVSVKKRVSIETIQSAQEAGKLLLDAISKGEKHTVTIAPYEDLRSSIQNSLMWVWITSIANHLGNEKEEVHFLLKDKFLTKIYERDDIEEYGLMVQTLRDLYKQDKEKALELRKQIVKLTSTTKATVEQMTEYLSEVERYGVELGANMAMPEKHKEFLS